MDSYCVIHFKDKDEKVKILTLLAVETEAKYIVTADMKDYVAKQFHVKITDYVDMKDQATDMGQENAIDMITVKDEAVNNIIDVVPVVDQPTINNNIDELHAQHTDIADTQPSNISAAQALLHVDNQQELFNIGTYVPYRERMVEPKEEVIDEVHMEGQGGGEGGLLMGIGGDGIDNYDNDNGSADIAMSTIDKDTQSTSITTRSEKVSNKNKRAIDESITTHNAPSSSRRSGRIVKQPKYSMDEDCDTDSEHQIKKSNKSSGTDMTRNTCQKCGTIMDRYVKKVYHVLSHANMTKYECMIDGCEYKTVYKSNLRTHMKKSHEKQPDNHREVQFTREQTEQFNKMMKECFPVTNENDEDNCQVCHQSVGGNMFNFKKEHSLHHIDFMLYKCMEDGCIFEGKTERAMDSHRRRHGNEASRQMTKIDLTAEQELKIENMLVKCFPEFAAKQSDKD